MRWSYLSVENIFLVLVFVVIPYRLQCNYSVVMCDFIIEWDQNKANTNQRKHGVTFDEAQSVFYDEYARVISDPDSSYGEARFIILGLSDLNNTLVVCHCYRGEDERIRIISARKATKHERKHYEGGRYA